MITEEGARKALESLNAQYHTDQGIPVPDRAELVVRHSIARAAAKSLGDCELRTAMIAAQRVENAKIVASAASHVIATLLCGGVGPVPLQLNTVQPEQVKTNVEAVHHAVLDTTFTCTCGKELHVEGSSPSVVCECGRVFFAHVMVTTAGPEVETG